MANLLKITVLALLATTLITGATKALPINRCARLLYDQAGRETIANVCNACVTVTVERSRPGQNNDTPNIREFNIPGGTNQPLPFRGPGNTRIANETACPSARGN